MSSHLDGIKGNEAVKEVWEERRDFTGKKAKKWQAGHVNFPLKKKGQREQEKSTGVNCVERCCVITNILGQMLFFFLNLKKNFKSTSSTLSCWNSQMVYEMQKLSLFNYHFREKNRDSRRLNNLKLEFLVLRFQNPKSFNYPSGSQTIFWKLPK